MQILFCMAFLLNIFLVSSALKIPSHMLLQANDILIQVPPFWRNFTGCPSTLASSLKLPPSPSKLLIPVILHILPACSTGTPHAESYDLPQLICCQSHDVTCHSSLRTGSVPTVLKAAYITPLIKKTDLVVDDVCSYCPISNLPVLSKLLECLVSRQLLDYITAEGADACTPFGLPTISLHRDCCS